jgi:hypothetical protein
LAGVAVLLNSWWWGEVEERDDLKDLNVDGRVILK